MEFIITIAMSGWYVFLFGFALGILGWSLGFVFDSYIPLIIAGIIMTASTIACFFCIPDFPWLNAILSPLGYVIAYPIFLIITIIVCITKSMIEELRDARS